MACRVLGSSDLKALTEEGPQCRLKAFIARLRASKYTFADLFRVEKPSMHTQFSTAAASLVQWISVRGIEFVFKKIEGTSL